MSDIINIKEKFKVDDSHSKIRGFVCAYDEEGRLVFSKENMIVESGRRFILNNGINEDSLKYVFLSENGTPASPGDLLSEMGDIVTTDHSREGYGVSTFNSIEITHDNFEGLTINSESQQGLSQMGFDIENIECDGKNDWYWPLYNPNILERKYLIQNGDKITVNGTEFTWNSGKFGAGFNILTIPENTEIKDGNKIWRGTEYFYETKWIDDNLEVEYYGSTFIYDPINKKFLSNILEQNYFSYIIDQENLVIKCLICFNDKSTIAAKSLGIVATDGINDVLFSRVTFPTYYKSNHQRLTFKYYIYF